MSRQEEHTFQHDPFDAAFWNERWEKGETGWDMGQASPPITAYMEQYDNKDAAILIPGCGNAYEAAWLADHGFTNITVMDIAPRAVEKLREKFADIPQIKILCEDFYRHRGQYDLMLEQTFFCAHPPRRRKEYARVAASVLNEKGKLAGVLFNTGFEKPGPPFGGNVAEYQSIFEPWFTIKKMEPCYNSIAPRAGSEVFIELVKK
ncbi:MAG: TPMT family class I SAM-dependent methyltransferase [Chitinophagaceae bacterium]|nr:TPMT family class I SAM-dependent methyltransferase [Chitinophagaceae bacterium]